MQYSPRLGAMSGQRLVQRLPRCECLSFRLHTGGAADAESRVEPGQCRLHFRHIDPLKVSRAPLAADRWFPAIRPRESSRPAIPKPNHRQIIGNHHRSSPSCADRIETTAFPLVAQPAQPNRNEATQCSPRSASRRLLRPMPARPAEPSRPTAVESRHWRPRLQQPRRGVRSAAAHRPGRAAGRRRGESR